MSITYHKAVSDDGGAIGLEITSGNVGELFPEITLDNQLQGLKVSRKFYIANSGLSDVLLHTLEINAYSPFSAILFESSGDAQVVGDLTGSEVDESPIQILVQASSHVSFWIQLDIPIGSTETKSFGTVDTHQTI